MKSLGLSRYALAMGAAAALLAACGGSQPPIGAPGVMPQSRAMATHAAHGKLWMKPRTSGDLLYVVSGGNFVYVVTYPGGTLLQTFSYPLGNATGACSDAYGNVFITTYGFGEPYDGIIYEFAHGGSTPIATFDETSYTPTGCSSDPTTGNLAVTNVYSVSSVFNGNVAIFPNAQAPPTIYSDSAFTAYASPGYDDRGNLFILGGVTGRTSSSLAELPNGSGTFTNITLNKQAAGTHIQWDGEYVAITGSVSTKRGGRKEESQPIVYRVKVSGSTGTVISSKRFSIKDDLSVITSWIQGNRIILNYGKKSVAFWKYPSGVKPLQVVTGFIYRRSALTVSVGSSH